ncbi:MAG: acetate/propionate family kinase [Gammaproteobacteria bacterium]
MGMEKNFLIVNIGSASKKYGFYSNQILQAQFYFEKVSDQITLTTELQNEKYESDFPNEHYDSAVEKVISILIEKSLLKNKEQITGIAIRIVAPGTYFRTHRFIDDEFVKNLHYANNYAPLHIQPVLDEIAKLNAVFRSTPLAGISDSAFHQDMPEYAKFYSLPKRISKEFDIYRFGYHGISLQSILKKIKHHVGTIPSKIIICHLGSGSSITAVKEGKSLDTSMGFSPLEGLIMGTRIGNIDAAAILYLIQRGVNIPNLEKMIISESGLLGLSGQSADIRDLIEAEQHGNQDATLALKIFIYWIRKYIGSYIIALGGLDLIVFTGAIGERSPLIRSRICSDLNFVGIHIDDDLNEKAINQDKFLHHSNSLIKIAAFLTEEQSEIIDILLSLIKE